MVNQLYIEEQLADLPGEDNPVAITLQVNNMADIKDRQATFSNAIKLPLTNANKKIWGNAQSDAFTQSQPYKRLNCKLIQNGIEQIVNGQASLLSVTDSYFETQITYGLTGFADAIKKRSYDSIGQLISVEDAKLVDLDWSDIPNFFMDLTTIVNSQLNSRITFSVVDYGDTLDNSSTINVSYLRPGIFFYDIFDHISKYTGYKFSGGSNYAAGLRDQILFTKNDIYDYVGNKYNGSLPISVAKNLPDLTLKDLIKDYMQRYFLTPVVDNYKKTIDFRSFDEVYENMPKAKDWTKKFIDDSRADAFDLGNYAQFNKLEFAKDNQTGGDFNFIVANENLESNKTLVTSIFAASQNVFKVGNLPVAQIKKFNSTPLPNYGQPFDNDVEVRVVHVENTNVGGSYLYKSSAAQQTSPYMTRATFRDWNYYLTNFGQGFLKLLKKARKVDRYAVLSELDIKDFDFFIPVYDGNDAKYYYVSAINNYISGKKTKVSLIRM